MPADRARSRARESRLLLMTRATWAEIVPAAQASTIAWSVVPSWDARIPILISPLSLYPSNSHSEWRAKRVRSSVWLAGAACSQIVGPQPGALGYPCQHPRPDFLIFVKGEYEIGPPRPGERAMGV